MSTKSQATEPKRGRGRPATFPGVETVSFLVNVPEETRQQVRDLAERRGVTLNAVIASIVAKAHARSESSARASKAAKRRKPAATEASAE